MSGEGTQQRGGRRLSDSASRGAGWAALPSYSLWDIALLLWRERILMAIAAAVVVVAGTALVLMLPKTYTSSARVLVLFDTAYGLDPVSSDNARGGTFQTQEIVQSEVSFLTSDAVKRRALEFIGIGHAYPNIAGRERLSEERRARLAARAMGRSTGVAVEPNSPAISVYLRNSDPDVAASLLNALLAEYQLYRREILLNVDTTGLGVERAAAEERLGALNSEIEIFLTEHDIGDFEGDRAAAQRRAGDIEDAYLSTQAERLEVEARLETLIAGLTRVPAEIELYVDDGASERIQTLRLERAELLSRFLPDSRPVREIDARLERLTQSQQTGQVGGGLTRRGANPVRQALDTERLQLRARASSLRSREEALARQLGEVRQRQLELQRLAATFESLDRRHATLSNTVIGLANREESERARRAVRADNVRIVEAAQAPLTGQSMRRPAFLGVVFLAGLTALFVGLFRIFAGAFAPTSASASRTVGLPVLAVVSPIGQKG